MLGSFPLVCCRLLIFLKINFFKKFVQEHFQSVKRLDSDQARHYVGPDLGPNCLYRLSDKFRHWQRKSQHSISDSSQRIIIGPARGII